MSSRAAAIATAERGWAVFPCRPGDKRPAVARWEQRACADPVRVGRFWPSERHNVGVACGPSRLVVVDLDTAAHGGELPTEWQGPGIVDGCDVLAELADRAGAAWPSTYTVRTASGGLHLYFAALAGRAVRNSAGKVGPMVDVRGAGGYVVGAGSVVRGQRYELVNDGPAAPLPGWLAALAAPLAGTARGAAAGAVPARGGEPGRMYGRLRGVVAAVLDAGKGQRNKTLHWAACRAGQMAAAGEVDAGTARRVLLRAAEDAGLVAEDGERAVVATINSGMRRGAAE